MQIPTEALSSIMLSDEQLMARLDRAGLWSKAAYTNPQWSQRLSGTCSSRNCAR
jgi:hypothetical protein